MADLRLAQALPARIILLRHGHKDPASATYNLSPAGFQRALALAHVIPSCFGVPSQIATFDLDSETSKSARSYQTAVPLAIATGVNIRIDRSSLVDSRASGRRILQEPIDRGGLLVVFWEHRHLPELAAGLGWAAMPSIEDDDFDKLYLLSYHPGSLIPQVRRFSQAALLSGAQPCALP
jgi:hypothetical protein